jgi:FlaG/FlaF family flagellin (archaellin)
MTWNTHHSRKTSKKRSRATEQFTAPPMNWRWLQKHSQTVHGTSIYQKDFSLTPIDYKSNDLEYTLQQKDLKKAVKGHGMAHSTTNKLEVGSKTLTDCAQDIH